MVILNIYNKEIEVETNIDFTAIRSHELIILCHGFISNMNNPPIRELYRRFSLKHGVLAFNFTGKNDGFPTYHECIEDLGSVLDYVLSKGINRISLIGHSMGGVVSVLFTALHPEIIKKIAVISIPYDITGAKTRYVFHTMHDKRGYLIIKNRDTQHLIRQEFLDTLADYSLRTALSKLAVPILIVQGNKDKVIPLPDAKRIYKEVSGGRRKGVDKKLCIIKNAGHLYVTPALARQLYSVLDTFIMLP